VTGSSGALDGERAGRSDTSAPTARARLVRAWREGLPAPWDWLLGAATVGYRAGLALHRTAYAAGLRRTRTLPCGVVTVGNLTVGGTGKTPTVEWLARALGARGRRVVVLSRGYGRRARSPVTVVSDEERVLATVSEAGDEPILLARRLPGVPVVVGGDRHRAGEAALARFGADVLVLDDGFQQQRLHADVAVVCLDAQAPWGHRGLLPRGSLREPPRAIARAHLLVLTHAAGVTNRAAVEAEVRRHAGGVPIAHATYEPEGAVDARTGAAVPLASLRGRPVLAFAGIAAPERFAATLRALGLNLRELAAFPDHHAYRPADLATIESRARATGAAVLVTTEKDAVRLPPAGTLPVWAVPVHLRLEDPPGAWWALLERRLARR
jgi:tetraacyldisaccharide 4'-kinase